MNNQEILIIVVIIILIIMRLDKFSEGFEVNNFPNILNI
jgi:hypothetical protein